MSDVAAEIKVGDTAPDFTLKDQDQKDVKLSDFRGKSNVVLAFYPLDWSPVCQGENKCLTDDFPKFQSAHAELFGISCDSFFSHKAWADSLDLKHRLLSDFNRGSREEVWPVFRTAELRQACDGHCRQERQGCVCEGARNQGGAGRQGYSRCPREVELTSPNHRAGGPRWAFRSVLAPR